MQPERKYRYGFPSLRIQRQTEAAIAQYPNVRFICCLAGEWWLLGKPAEFDKGTPYYAVLDLLSCEYDETLGKLVKIAPREGFYCFNETEQSWYMGATWQHAEIWLKTGAFQKPAD